MLKWSLSSMVILLLGCGNEYDFNAQYDFSDHQTEVVPTELPTVPIEPIEPNTPVIEPTPDPIPDPVEQNKEKKPKKPKKPKKEKHKCETI